MALEVIFRLQMVKSKKKCTFCSLFFKSKNKIIKKVKESKKKVKKSKKKSQNFFKKKFQKKVKKI